MNVTEDYGNLNLPFISETEIYRKGKSENGKKQNMKSGKQIYHFVKHKIGGPSDENPSVPNRSSYMLPQARNYLGKVENSGTFLQIGNIFRDLGGKTGIGECPRKLGKSGHLTCSLQAIFKVFTILSQMSFDLHQKQ